MLTFFRNSHKSLALKVAFICNFFVNGLQSQNLIPNPSFEEWVPATDICPAAFYSMLPWQQVACSTPPVNYNRCNSSEPWLAPYGVPVNQWGSQEPIEGDDYIAIVTYSEKPGMPCYARVELTEPLEEGVEYCFSLYANLAGLSAYGTINFHGLFTTSPTSACMNADSTWAANAQAHLFTNDVDTANWMYLYDSFIAIGGERYLTLGNFTDPNSPDTLFISSSPAFNQIANYFFDQISLMRCDVSVGESLEPLSIELYPNPTRDQIVLSIPLELLGSDLELISNLGQLLLTEHINQLRSNIDIGTLNTGTYFLRIRKGTTTLVEKFTVER